MIYLAEIQAHDGSAVRTLYLATEGITTRPNDVPANTYYIPRLLDAGNFERRLFSDGTTRGASSVGKGDVVIVNGDPGNTELIDEWLDWGFDGRAITIKRLANARSPISSAVTLFRGTCEQIVSTNAIDRFELRIRDRLADLDKPLLTTRYAGTTTTSGPTAEGNEDLRDQVKPLVFGRVLNIPCVLVNPYDLTYQASNSAISTITVYDAGVALTLVGDFANIAAMLAATVLPGQYATCKMLGLFRLGGAPFKAVTADVVEGPSAASRSAAQIARRVLLAHGIATADILTATFTALDVKNAADCGIYVTGETTALNVITQVLDSIGGWLAPDHLGRFEVGRFEAPSGAAVEEFDDTQFLTGGGGDGGGLERLAVGDAGKGIPTWRVTVRSARVWQVHGNSDLTGSVTALRRAFLASEYRESKVEDATVKTKHLHAPEITVDTCLAFQADGDVEAARLLALHSVRRDRYLARIPVDQLGDATLGRVVTLTTDRLGLDAGELFTVIGRVDEYDDDMVSLDVWG